MRRLYSLLLFVPNLFLRIKFKKVLKEIGEGSSIGSGTQITGGKNITIGNCSTIGKGGWLASVALTGNHVPLLRIGNDCSIGRYCHIYSTKSIIIENGTLIAEKVYISDNIHSYDDVKTYIKDQPVKQIGEVVIGEGSWLGENVCVIGSCIGKHCVIGANSVVTKDIPDYCVAVGAPARVIKYYDLNNKKWVTY